MPYNEDESSGSDSDAGFDEDMEALRKACSVTGVNDSVDDPLKASTTCSDSGDTYASEDEDIELLRSIQQRFSVPTNDIGSEQYPISMKPLSIIMPSGLSDDNEDYGEDFETLRAIQRRFSQYHEQQEGEFCTETRADCVDGSNTNQNLELSSNITPETPYANNSEGHEPGSEIIPAPDCGFPRSAQAFVEAIKKNRICQKFIRNKIGQIEARLEENKKLRERVKILKDFQVACRKKTGRALSQKKDPRIQLISVPKQRSNAAKDKETHAINQGPAENCHVADYRDAMSKYPFSLIREPWSTEENENLLKGIKQQFQEMLTQNLFSGEDVDCHDMDNMLTEITHREISAEEIRSFLPKVNWERLASMYVIARSGPECQSRWMNSEDPLINCEAWSLTEDKKLLYTVQNRGLSNWIDIADALGTNRTPFQCLSRFQRSLNASIIKNEWTPPEDEELRNAVAEYGETNWQLVASTLEGRTGTQCSNRWKKSLNPMRERVGKWAPDEDKHLKIAVKLFGAKNWNKIARFVPGRTQVQCRERWVNCLDPALNMNEWTPEEDLKLKNAISEHGYLWSKVAACVPPRTDSQCLRRWKVLLPHEVPMLQRARKMKKAALISNFVDREHARPALTVNDFVAPLLLESPPEPNQDHITSDNQNQRAVPRIRSRRARKVNPTEKVLKLIDEDEDDGDMKGNNNRISKRKQSLSKNNPNISSQESELSDLNVDRDNSEIKKYARKRKRRGKREEKEMNLNMNILNDSQMCRETPPIYEPEASPDMCMTEIESPEGEGEGAITTITDNDNDTENNQNQQMGLSLDPINGAGSSPFKTKAATGKRKRKPRGNKEHEEDGTFLNQKKTKRSHLSLPTENKSNISSGEIINAQAHESHTWKQTQRRGNKKKNKNKQHDKSDEAFEPLVAAISDKKTKTTNPNPNCNRGDICSPSSPTEAPPVLPIEKAPSITTPRNCKTPCKQGGDDEETIGSFFSRLKRRSCSNIDDEIGDEETIGSFFGKLKKKKRKT
ncbi:unnamed protein product [Lactuca saligna]|uniref:Uncharacterized protein n=1 Tax=Lactuca saligna TaxID=75948 RepID=A0AA35VJ17_LACSI|nr:unnamed protein product [Lactuca saligna]